MDTTNLAGHTLSIYDVEDVMNRAWEEHRALEKQVAVTSPQTRKAVDELLRRYQPDETRDPSRELAHLRSLATRWGTITFREEPTMPPGTILFMNLADYDNWQGEIDEAKHHAFAKIINIGEN